MNFWTKSWGMIWTMGRHVRITNCTGTSKRSICFPAVYYEVKNETVINMVHKTLLFPLGKIALFLYTVTQANNNCVFWIWIFSPSKVSEKKTITVRIMGKGQSCGWGPFYFYHPCCCWCFCCCWGPTADDISYITEVSTVVGISSVVGTWDPCCGWRLCCLSHSSADVGSLLLLTSLLFLVFLSLLGSLLFVTSLLYRCLCCFNPHKMAYLAPRCRMA
jgi:hypothetical protein